MNRPWQIWIAFGLSMSLVACVLGWLTWKTVELEKDREEALGRADLEESVRLALWRLDSVLNGIVGRENARPYFVYQSFLPDEYGRASRTKGKGTRSPPEPSPLLTEEVPYVRLHFQLEEAEGTFSCAQVPPSGKLELVAGLLSPGRVEKNREMLSTLEGLLADSNIEERLPETDLPSGSPWALLAAGQDEIQGTNNAWPDWRLYPPQSQSAAPSVESTEESPPRQEDAAPQTAQPALQQMPEPMPVEQPRPSTRPPLQEQQMEVAQQAAPLQQRAPNQAGRNEAYLRRQEILNVDDYNFRMANNLSLAQQAFQGKQLLTAETSTEGLLYPLWIDNELILARRVLVNGRRLLQGCWLDWPELKTFLLDSISHLLPRADLIRVSPREETTGFRRLVSLPVRLEPGADPADFPGPESPLQMSLFLAWACISLAALAVAALLKGTLSLSERRASFVSAVTHELRTPLTTFRMYTEMLTGGMVPDERRKQHYLSTMGTEARRLSHLVENVLAYARLERNRRQSRLEKIEVRVLLERSRERLEERTAQTGMKLELEGGDDALSLQVLADPGALEQILFNLVDNACKYGSTGSVKSIAIGVVPHDDTLEIRVRDHGAGVSRDMRRRLFQPFSKSAHEAASSAPGVGLGLALSRRLAREMGGDLRLDGKTNDGACFVLTLRQAS